MVWLKSVKSYMDINPNSEVLTTNLCHMGYLSTSTDHPALFEIGFNDTTSVFIDIFVKYEENINPKI